MIFDASRLRRGRPPMTERVVPRGAVVIGRSETGQPVFIAAPNSTSAHHLAVFAASGAGKTILLVHAMVEAIVWERENLPQEAWTTILLIDCKSETVTRLLQALAYRAPHLLREVHLLDPFGAPFALNIVQMQHSSPLEIVANQVVGLINNLSTGTSSHLGMGARQTTLLQHLVLAALACRHIPGASLLFVQDALRDKQHGIQQLARLTSSARARDFLLSNDDIAEELRASTNSRITAIAPFDAAERLWTAPNAVSFTDLLRPGSICLVDIGQPFGALPQLTEFYGNLLVQLAGDLILSRQSPGPPSHIRVVVDEFQVVAASLEITAVRFLTQGRSKNTSITLCSQGTALVQEASPTLLRCIETNATAIVGRMSPKDAQLMVSGLGPAPGVDIPVSAVRTKLHSLVCNLADQSFLRLTPGSVEPFKATDVPVGAWEAAGAQQNIDAVRQRHALPKEAAPRLTLAAAAAAARTTARSDAPKRRPPRSRFG